MVALAVTNGTLIGVAAVVVILVGVFWIVRR
jgi:hypothetical protein